MEISTTVTEIQQSALLLRSLLRRKDRDLAQALAAELRQRDGLARLLVLAHASRRADDVRRAGDAGKPLVAQLLKQESVVARHVGLHLAAACGWREFSPHAVQALVSDSDFLAVVARYALVDIGTPEDLRRVYQLALELPQHRRKLYPVLGWFARWKPLTREAMEYLARFADDPGDRAMYLHSLGLARSRLAAPLVERYMNDPDPYVRSAARNALPSLGVPMDWGSSEQPEAFAKRYEEYNLQRFRVLGTVRRFLLAPEQLARTSGLDRQIPLWIASLGSSDWRAREAAMASLRRVGHLAVTELHGAAASADLETRARAREVLGDSAVQAQILAVNWIRKEKAGGDEQLVRFFRQTSEQR